MRKPCRELLSLSWDLFDLYHLRSQRSLHKQSIIFRSHSPAFLWMMSRGGVPHALTSIPSPQWSHQLEMCPRNPPMMINVINQSQEIKRACMLCGWDVGAWWNDIFPNNQCICCFGEGCVTSPGREPFEKLIKTREAEERIQLETHSQAFNYLLSWKKNFHNTISAPVTGEPKATNTASSKRICWKAFWLKTWCKQGEKEYERFHAELGKLVAVFLKNGEFFVK